MISADLLRGYTDSIILRRLLDRDGYGYQISREVLRISGGKVELKEATLYTAFRRLEAAGYIRSYWGDEATGARRRYYSLLDAGRKKLEEDATAWQETSKVMENLIAGLSSSVAPEEASPVTEKEVQIEVAVSAEQE
jgi:DNA-binding PadR family transcriptional regulator